MKSIKKTTLIAAITAMAAFAVPAMASAAVWGPVNTNKTLGSAGSATYSVQGPNNQYSFACSSSSLGVHVRTPASSTADITSASFTGCTSTSTPGCGAVTVTATGLPWAATWGASPVGVTFTQHLLVTEACLSGATLNVDGNAFGSYSNATHTLTAGPVSGLLTGGMTMTYMGSSVGPIGGGFTTPWHDATNTLTLT